MPDVVKPHSHYTSMLASMLSSMLASMLASILTVLSPAARNIFFCIKYCMTLAINIT